MPIRWNCSSCGKRLKAPDDAAGRRARCQRCSAAVVVPAAAAPFAAPANELPPVATPYLPAWATETPTSPIIAATWSADSNSARIGRAVVIVGSGLAFCAVAVFGIIRGIDYTASDLARRDAEAVATRASVVAEGAKIREIAAARTKALAEVRAKAKEEADAKAKPVILRLIEKELAPTWNAGSKVGEWRTVVVPAGINRTQLVELARALHRRNPRSSFEFIDDDSRYAEYTEWVETGRGPEKELQDWADKHDLALVNTKLIGNRWQLYSLPAGRVRLHFDSEDIDDGEPAKKPAPPRIPQPGESWTLNVKHNVYVPMNALALQRLLEYARAEDSAGPGELYRIDWVRYSVPDYPVVKVIVAYENLGYARVRGLNKDFGPFSGRSVGPGRLAWPGEHGESSPELYVPIAWLTAKN